MRKIPFIMLLYFTVFVDRANLGFALLTMNEDLGLSPASPQSIRSAISMASPARRLSAGSKPNPAALRAGCISSAGCGLASCAESLRAQLRAT